MEDDLEDDRFWSCIVCGWEGDPDKVGRFCPCGDRDLDAEEADENGTLGADEFYIGQRVQIIRPGLFLGKKGTVTDAWGTDVRAHIVRIDEPMMLWEEEKTDFLFYSEDILRL